MSYYRRDEKHSRHVQQHFTMSFNNPFAPCTLLYPRLPHPFFLHLWFSEMQIENRAMFPTNSSCRWIQQRWKKSVSCNTTNGRSARRPIDRDRERYTGTLVAPRKRSMSLLAGSWRSTELASTLKRKLNEISNRQELPRIGPIKPPPVPRTCTRVY